MSENVKATVLVDNAGTPSLPGEWGLSVFIRYGNYNLLLDTGNSDLFARNAEKLGISIADAEAAVLSHAHYDHSRGMGTFFQINRKANFYLRESAAENCYARKWIFRRYIGLPKGITTDFSDRIQYVRGNFTLSDNVFLIPHSTPGLEAVGKREKMYRKTASGWIPDDFSHEQSLVLDTTQGLVIFNSCSHGGAANIIREAAAAFPEKRVFGLIGGFHLYNKSENEIHELAEKINETGISYVCTGHCTKDRAYGILKTVLGDKLHSLHVGRVMEF